MPGVFDYHKIFIPFETVSQFIRIHHFGGIQGFSFRFSKNYEHNEQQ